MYPTWVVSDPQKDESVMSQILNVTPMAFLAALAKLGKPVVIGQVINFHDESNEIVMAEHPIYGPIPEIRVTALTTRGTFGEGEFTCCAEDCNEVVHVHPGDVFQKRFCSAHQKAKQNLARRGVKSAEEAEQKELAKAQAKAEKEAAKAEAKLKALEEKLNAAKKAALVAKVAAEKGVTVSEKAVA